MEKNEKPKNFEKAFERLEKILKALNEREIPLDESLQLFEEADSLINSCTNNLDKAEQKIETLIKNRNFNIEVDENKTPITEPFEKDTEKVFSEE